MFCFNQKIMWFKIIKFLIFKIANKLSTPMSTNNIIIQSTLFANIYCTHDFIIAKNYVWEGGFYN